METQLIYLVIFLGVLWVMLDDVVGNKWLSNKIKDLIK